MSLSKYMPHNNISKAFNSAVGLAASAISNLTPSTIRAKSRGRRADRERNIIKTARAFDDAPNFKDGQPTDALKMRQAADRVRSKRIKK